MISSQNVANAPFNQVAGGFSAKSVTFDAPNDIPGVVQNILALVVPDLIYRRAFEEAQGAFGIAAFHASINGGVSVAMFDRNSPLHDLAKWEQLYVKAPQEEITAIQDTIKSLMDTWALCLSSLSSFRAIQWHQNWRLAAAKAINGGSIHRSFFFALSPESCTNGCTPFVRKRICDRDMRSQQPHRGILGLQILLQGDQNEGFALSAIAEWAENGRSGIQLVLRARFMGCEGVERFKDVLSGAWNPPADQPNSGRLSRALKDVRDSFLTGQSTVLCAKETITLVVRIEEAELR
ncbi:MAG: hypothetical protein L0287_34580 [Anaerolineae bacterium]|nr:hypothetical protein [Anaerolineae bacterium]